MAELINFSIPKGPKYRQIHDALKGAILTGEYARGAKLPSESELLKRFGASRLTGADDCTRWR